MAVFHECDRCNKKINEPEEKVHRINFKLSITPRINDENINAKSQDSLDGLEFCETCARELFDILHKPFDESHKTLGI